MSRAAHKAATCARSDLERAALAHPSFVHHTEFVVLDHVASGLGSANRDVPFGADDAQYRAYVFSYLATLLGAHCCLCGEVRSPNRLHSFRTSLPFCKWLCGDFDGTCLTGAYTYPLCQNCNSRITIWSARNNGTGWGSSCQPVLKDEMEFVTVLHIITNGRDFRSRVKANAERFLSARFDPRRAPCQVRKAA